MKLTIIPRVWNTPQGNVKTYAVKKDGMPFKEFFTIQELEYFKRGVMGNGAD